MAAVEREVLPLRSTVDIVNVRQRVRRMASEAGFSLVDQTKIITAASEIGRNAVVYGRGATAVLELFEQRRSPRFEDHVRGLRAGHSRCRRGTEGWLYYRHRFGSRLGRRKAAGE